MRSQYILLILAVVALLVIAFVGLIGFKFIMFLGELLYSLIWPFSSYENPVLENIPIEDYESRFKKLTGYDYIDVFYYLKSIISLYDIFWLFLNTIIYLAFIGANILAFVLNC